MQQGLSYKILRLSRKRIDDAARFNWVIKKKKVI